MNNKDMSHVWETMKKLKEQGKLSIPTQQDIENEPTALAFTYNDVVPKSKCFKTKNILSNILKFIALIFGIIPIILAIPSVIIFFIAEHFEFIDSTDKLSNDIQNLNTKQDNILKESDYAEAYDAYLTLFIGYEDVPTIDWFIDECKNNKNFRNKFLNNIYNI
jgi:hypothetical protein